MVSLKDLRSAPVALDWHEAVAVGAALGAQLVDARATACPSGADVALLPSGDVRVLGPGLVDAPAAAGVALILAELLASSPCPAELRQLIDRYGRDRRDAGGGPDALADLVSELAFFERPGRREVLAALAARAEPALERARRAAALDALTERTRVASGAVPVTLPASTLPAVDGRAGLHDLSDDRPGWDPAEAGGLGRLLVPAAVGLIAFVAVAYGAAAWLDRPAPSPTRVEGPVEDPPDSRPASPAAPPSASAPASPRRAPDVRAGAASPPPASTAVASSPAQVAPAAGPTAPAARDLPPSPAARSVEVVVAERDGRVVPSSSATAGPVRGRGRQAGPVFDSSDPLVTPAVLVRPRLPDNPPPGVPEEQIGTLEIVVSESGAVDHVRLISPANRYQERMIVAAAKAWQFQPATRHGRPVRYRTRIRVTL